MQTKKKLILALTAVFALNIFLISCIQTVKAASYRRGSYGETVTEIQEKLSEDMVTGIIQDFIVRMHHCGLTDAQIKAAVSQELEGGPK